jgi:probable addiction module antidote protein
MAVKLTRWDTAEHLHDAADCDAYLDACIEEGDAALVAHALGVIARARNMSQLARETGLTREGLYKALSRDGNPSLDTIMRAARSLGYRLRLERIE